MTLLDRALSKAYGVPSPDATPVVEDPVAECPVVEDPVAQDTVAEESSVTETEVVRGWVDPLRSPLNSTEAVPAWEWPAICHKLLAVTGAGFSHLAGQLLDACAARNLQSMSCRS